MTNIIPTVLVVEDETLIRLGIATYLEDEGFAVLEAGNASDAIALLDAHPEIRVLFTDIDMPGKMDGLMLAAAVRDRWPPIRIAVTSGHRSVEAGELPKDAKFFPKPYDPDALVVTFRAMASV